MPLLVVSNQISFPQQNTDQRKGLQVIQHCLKLLISEYDYVVRRQSPFIGFLSFPIPDCSLFE